MGEGGIRWQSNPGAAIREDVATASRVVAVTGRTAAVPTIEGRGRNLGDQARRDQKLAVRPVVARREATIGVVAVAMLVEADPRVGIARNVGAKSQAIVETVLRGAIVVTTAAMIVVTMPLGARISVAMTAQTFLSTSLGVSSIDR